VSPDSRRSRASGARARPSLAGVILVDAREVTVSRPDRPLFAELSVTISAGDRLGVVGINGTGKSTLLRVLAGERDPDSGEVRVGRGVRITFLDQQAPLPPGTVRQVVGGEWEGEAVLTQLGMGGHLDRPTDQLSGGEARRVALARVLVQPADLLVLDEPTNHLDLDAVAWLEERLARHRGGLVLVTHDRHVLDRTTTRILELDRGRGHVHEGGYAGWLEARAEREVAAAGAEAIRRNLARSELAWLRRGAPARTSKPRARVEAATALVEARPEGPARPAELALEFPTPRLGDVVVELHGATVSAPDGRLVARDLDLLLDRRERLGIVGPNGAGKTTLLEVLAGTRAPEAGQVVHGSTVRLGYYRQQGPDLDPMARAREVVAGPHRAPDWTDARLLESFWFPKDAHYAPVGTLSGGERRRLQLLTVLAAKPNVLLLDEPTNDLDLETLRALEDYLEDWPGAVVVVSHDRALLERVVTDVLVVDGAGSAARWPGGFAAWEAAWRAAAAGPSARTAQARPAKAARDRPSAGRSASTLGHLIREVEKDLARLERRRANLADELDRAGGDHVALARVGAELAAVDTEIGAAEERWLALAEEREAAGR
jgi:ABC transport system ATP-binding/permease protein